MSASALEVLKTDRYIVFQMDERVNLDFTADNYGLICVCNGRHLEGIIYITSVLKFCKWKNSVTSGFEDLSREYERTLNICDDSIIVISNQGKVLWFNEQTINLCSKVNLFSGQSVDALQQEYAFFPSVLQSVLNKKISKTVIHRMENGHLLIATGSPLFDCEGKIERVVVVTRDFTFLLEQLRNKLNPRELEILVEQPIYSNQSNVRLHSELDQLRKSNLYNKKMANFVSQEMRAILQLAECVAKVDSTVLLLGESGVGKDVLATTIHQHGHRKDGPFIKINCGAIPENLLESELFGYEPGSFTGAGNKRKLGLFEAANEGTLFLDEVAELPPSLQVKLLHALQERSFLRVGGSRPIHVNVRIIAATNKNLVEMIAAGTFREDLYYRLNVVPITIPPLRKRKEDIPPLLLHFLATFNQKYQRNRQLSEEVVQILLNYDWPGNIREVENLIERLVVIGNGDIVYPYELPQDICKHNQFSNILNNRIHNMTLAAAVQAFETEYIQEAYKLYKNTAKVAEVLGVNRSTITRKLQRDGAEKSLTPNAKTDNK